MSIKIAFLVFALVAVMAVYADLETESPRHLRREWGVEDVKKKIDQYLEKATREHVLARLEAGINYLKGLGGSMKDVPRAVEQIFKRFNEEQKQQIVSYLESLKKN